ncbi:hypothetical protein FB45DRAFT_97028 [Roridomyces roridus]|uniref:F-box domain-containing protein n=1 Tax=Roridomyces roridus TaxID=1738132 RepID=A0AAD7FIV2_9AGAR|nr:hypothetical protein FB45DRAFT_97028 [Roridomyces roridus]
MAPRYSTFLRYRISDDVLAAILEHLDPRTLLSACKAFKRIYAIVMGYHALRYKFELAVSGMRDGAAPRAAAPLLARLHLLLNYRADWPRLHWTHEYKMQVITPSHVGTSGGFIHQIRPHGVYSTLEITELPSCRTGRSPTLTRRLRYTSPPIETVFIDPAQALIVAAHIFCQNGIIGLQLQFRDLWTFAKHPIAPAESYEIPTQSVAPVAHVTIYLVGSKLAVTLEFVGGKINHLIMDWRTFGARWIDDQDICLLDEDFLLVLCKRAGSPPVLNLCNITNIVNMVVLRQYELPGAWANSSIKFSPNTATRQRSPTALFCSDPANRVLVVAAKPLVKTSTSASWLFINEGYFRGVSSRRDRAVVSWSSWGQYCVVKDLPRISRTLVRGPYAIGSRVAYLQSESGTQKSTLNLIEFAPFPDSGTRLNSSWPVVGSKATLFPSETARALSSTTVEHYAVDDIGVTEDNIVLFLELQPGFRPVNVLTFGAPPTASARPSRR